MKKLFLSMFLALCSTGLAAEDYYPTSDSSTVSSFSRDSIAYLNGTEYGIDVKRIKDVLLVSSSDGAVITGEAEDGGDIIPYCMASGTMYGRGSSDYKVYKSLDGKTWTRTAYAQNADGCLFSTINNNLIAVNNGTQKIYRSTDGGDSFVEVYTCPHPTSQWLIWSYAKNSTTMMLCDYGSSGGFPDSGIPDGRYVHRSFDDGASWEICLDGNSVTDKIRHWHTVGYHAASGRWLAYAGDLMDYNKIMYSTDEGDNWDYLYDNKNCFIKPVSVVDYGSGTEVLFGDDLFFGISTLNVLTGEVRPSGPQLDKRGANGYVFCVAHHDGIYYGCTYDLTTRIGCINPVIYVSNDLVNWSVYHRFENSEHIRGTLGFVGYLGGKLHFQVTHLWKGPKHFAISPAKATMVNGSVIMPAVTNLLNTENLSSFETSPALVSASPDWTVSRTTEEHYHGAACMKGQGIDNDPSSDWKKIFTGNISLTAGKSYIVSFAVKGSANGAGLMHLYKNFEPVGLVNPIDDVYFPVTTTWQEVKSSPYPITTSGNYRFYVSLIQGPVAQTVYIDSLQIAECPVNEWQVGGIDAAPDILTATVTTGDDWTDIFVVQTTRLSALYEAESNLYIRTWYKDADNFVSLYYNPADSKFYIQRKINGSALAAVATKAPFWQSNAILKFAFRSCPTCTSLSVQNGKAVEHISDGAVTAINSAEITMINGDVNSSNQFPGVYADDCEFVKFFPHWLSSADIESLFNLTQPAISAIVPVYPQNDIEGVPLDCNLSWSVLDANFVELDLYLGNDWELIATATQLTGDSKCDINSDHEVDFVEIEEVINQWLLPPSSPDVDINNDGYVDFDDFAIFAEDFRFAFYKAHFTADVNTYEPERLNPGTEYYWRIDGIDSEDNILQGPVWNFTTQ